MITTNYEYIHEYSLFDDMFDFLESTKKEIDIAVINYNTKKRQLEMKSFFEGTLDAEMIIEAEGQGVLAKIGNTVMALIKKIRDFISKIGDKILGNTRIIKSDVEIVNQMIAQNPELKTKVANGINNEWFTYKDIAAYEKDIVGLITMLEKKAIDHQTFMDRVKAATTKFNNSAKPIIATGCTIAALIGIVPKVAKSCASAKQSMQKLSKDVEEFRDRVDRNYSEKDVNMAHAVLNALSNAIGIGTKECQERTAGQGKLASFISSFKNGKIGKAIHVDDEHRDARHAKAFSKRADKSDKAQQRADDIVRHKDDDIKKQAEKEEVEQFKIMYADHYDNDDNNNGKKPKGGKPRGNK